MLTIKQVKQQSDGLYQLRVQTLIMKPNESFVQNDNGSPEVKLFTSTFMPKPMYGICTKIKRHYFKYNHNVVFYLAEEDMLLAQLVMRSAGIEEWDFNPQIKVWNTIFITYKKFTELFTLVTDE